MKTKLFSGILLLSLLASLSACGETASSPVDSEKTGEQTAAEQPQTEAVILPDLPETDWGGRDFHVLGRVHNTYTQFNNFEVYSAGEDGEVVNDAVFRRNTTLEERYNVVISQELVDYPENTLPKLVRAGDDTFDLAFCEIGSIGALGEQGIYYNLNDVKYIDFTKPWWNPDVNAAVAIKDKLFYTSSDFSLRDKSRAYIMTYNPDLAANYDLPDLIETVRAGKWTLDVMEEYCRIVSGDVNGDGVMNENDQYGLTMDSYNSFATFMFSAGVRMIENDKNNVPQLVLNSERTVNAVDRVMSLTCDTNIALFCDDFMGRVAGDHWSVSGDVFNAGRALFGTCFPHSLKNKSEKCDFNFLVAPFPKYDESQEKYLTMADIFVMLFGIPASVQDPDFSGFMLEALSAASTDTTLHAYYEVSCKTKYAYNEASAEMLDLIFDGIVYDEAILFKSGFGLYDLFGVTLPKAKKNNFVSEYTKLESKAQKALDKLLEAVDAIE